METDLATTDGVDRLWAAAAGRPVDALLANAGHGLGHAFLDQDFEDARHVIDTNVTGTIYLVQLVGRAMRSRGKGRILLTGSIAGFMPGTYQAVYNGTKAFVDSFSFALRAELKDTGVTVTCLMPGATETDFFERADMLDTKVGQGKKDDPADVARVGFDAMMRGDGDVVSGWKNKLQSAIANLTPAGMLAEQHRKMAEPGSAQKAKELRRHGAMARAAAASRPTRRDRAQKPIAVPVPGTALLLIDVINDLAFDGSEALVAQAEPMALRLAALKRRASAAGMPAIYINDNFGQWRSDFRKTVAHCIVTLVAGTSRVPASEAHLARLLRAEAQALGLLRHDARHVARDAPDPSRDSDRHRGQYLRALHRERRLHARPQDLRACRLHRLEHGGRQRSRAAPDCDRAQRRTSPIHGG